jgi:predicted HicB family RNase H-like nuclease
LASGILSYNPIFIDMRKLNKKIVVRVTQRQLEYIVEETLKQNKSISQVVRQALVEQFIKKL